MAPVGSAAVRVSNWRRARAMMPGVRLMVRAAAYAAAASAVWSVGPVMVSPASATALVSSAS